jgi:hypothetical protein
MSPLCLKCSLCVIIFFIISVILGIILRPLIDKVFTVYSWWKVNVNSRYTYIEVMGKINYTDIRKIIFLWHCESRWSETRSYASFSGERLLQLHNTCTENQHNMTKERGNFWGCIIFAFVALSISWSTNIYLPLIKVAVM